MLRKARKARLNSVARAMLDAFHERIAICEIDGRLSDADAARVAVDEVLPMLA